MDPNTAGWVLIAALALPLVGAALMLLLPNDDEERIKRFAVLVTGVSFALVTAMTVAFYYSRSGELQFVTNVAWIDAINQAAASTASAASLPSSVAGRAAAGVGAAAAAVAGQRPRH